MNKEPDLGVNIAGLEFSNPVMTASGTFGYGLEFDKLLDINRLGAIVVKGLSLKPAKGNPPPRIVETAGGMLNSIGLENIGVEAFINKKMPLLKKLSPHIIANIYGKSVDEYAMLAEKLDDVEGISFIEINVSCPNVKSGGMAFGTDPDAAGQVVSAVRKKTALPLMAKLTPNVSDIASIAKRVEERGADSISLINTLAGMSIDIHERAPALGAVTGGLSGPAIKPVALRMVWEVAEAVDIPVIGVGGVMNGDDAIEFLMAGATAIQVGTANFINPRASIDIIDDIKNFLLKKKIDCVKDVIGVLRSS